MQLEDMTLDWQSPALTCQQGMGPSWTLLVTGGLTEHAHHSRSPTPVAGHQTAWVQGLDWRDPALPACNAGLNPIQEGFYDGIDVNPLEVLFIKVWANLACSCQQVQLGQAILSAVQLAPLVNTICSAWGQTKC